MSVSEVVNFGYDSGTDQSACGKPYRSAKMYQPPCDLVKDNYCTSAGSTYPWHAVRRFIRENQGLMKRMYGSERQISVLRAEMESNQLREDDDLYGFKNRYARRDDRFEETNVQMKENSSKDMKKNEEAPELIAGDSPPPPPPSSSTARSPELNRREQLGESSPTTNDDSKSNRPKDVLQTPNVIAETTKTEMKLANYKANAVHQKKDQISNTKFVYSQEGPNVNLKMPHFRPTTTLKSPPNETTSATESGLSTALDAADNSTTETTTAEMTSVESGATESTTLDATSTAAQEEVKAQNAAAAVLFQDMEDANRIPQVPNYKLRGVNACPVKEEVVAPFWANNTRGEVLALLNLYPFEQYVHWEKCTFEHRQMYCRDGCRCEQQYRLHRLLAYDPNNECRGIFSDWFRFPSCCVCKCYDMPAEFRVTSRSPRSADDGDIPDWFKKRITAYDDFNP